MNVPFLSLKDVTNKYKDEIHEAALRVIDSGWYLQGKENEKFEADYATYIGTKYCVGVANGLQALELMIRACKLIGKWNDGDEIIVQANTYIATILSISQNRLKPILVEPDPDTLELKAESIIRAKARICNETINIKFVKPSERSVKQAKLEMRRKNLAGAWNSLIRGSKRVD